MLGWQSLFMSCTSRSMFALLLASVFIFSAITCPVIRCCTWKTIGEGSWSESKSHRGRCGVLPVGRKKLSQDAVSLYCYLTDTAKIKKNTEYSLFSFGSDHLFSLTAVHVIYWKHHINLAHVGLSNSKRIYH